MKHLAKYCTILVMLSALCISCKTSENKPKLKSITEDDKTYILQDSILITSVDGAEIALLVVRDKAMNRPLPTLLHHTIYARENDYKRALLAASQGYVGVVSYTRGKAWSTSDIIPYEHEGDDVNAVIDWITKQSWSNGKVGMLGGSYTGFTQWAASKKLHPALKTIVPSASSSPGIGEPAENGVYMTFLYPWFPHVSNNKFLDHESYNDGQRWNKLKQDYYQTGAAYRSLDSLDGTPNPIFNKQLDHPTFDSYWHDMVPYKSDFSNIDIPVLSTTGYFDGGQLGVLYYFNEHYKHNKNAEHYLVIGPFGHLGSQYIPEHEIGNYVIDSAAQINITKLTFEWFDYIFKNGPKPDLLKDKINFQVMGTNRWRHAPSMARMSNDTIKFFLSNISSNLDFVSRYETGNNGNKRHFSLSEAPPSKPGFIRQEVDFTDRTMEGENNYFNANVVDTTLPLSNGYSFITEPFQNDVEFNGAYFGNLKVTINKKDFDCSMVMYEQTPERRYFKLTQQFIGRASLAKNGEKRQLLTPGVKEDFPFTNVRMTSRILRKGSRLILVLNVNKHPHEQINYGTGKDVSNETIEDANHPLIVQWHNDSFVKIPIYRPSN